MKCSVIGSALLGAILLIFRFSAIAAQRELCQTFIQECQRDEFVVGSKRMVLFSKEKTFQRAKEHCKKIGMRLLATPTKDQVELLKTYLNSRIFEGPPDVYFWGLWLDATNLDEDRVWKWRTHAAGQNLTYTSWGKGEPNGGDREHCLELKWIVFEETRWNDARCEHRKRYICEVDEGGLN